MSIVRLLALGGLIIGDARLGAQAPELVYGRDYSFERLTATRVVHDAEDDGRIQLVTYVWKPLTNDRHEVVFFMHGSTGGQARSPKEPATEGAPRPLTEWFLKRGYTIVAPMRRGMGASTGTYIEECPSASGKCGPKDQMALTTRGLREASLDNDAVLDQLVFGKLVPPNAKILLVGQSRGGFLALLTSAQRPAHVRAVINFAGGWHNLNNDQGPGFQERVDTQTVRLADAATKYSGSTLWIYADRDPLNSERGRQHLLRAWREAGGKVEYFFIAEHALPNAHLVVNAPALWTDRVEAFLKTLEVPTKNP